VCYGPLGPGHLQYILMKRHCLEADIYKSFVLPPDTQGAEIATCLQYLYAHNFIQASRTEMWLVLTRLRAGRPGFNSRWGQWWNFLFTTASIPTLRPIQPPDQRVLSPGVRRPGREAEHLPPSSAEVNGVWSYTSTPPTRLYGVVLN
jgi:hypothetical protein